MKRIIVTGGTGFIGSHLLKSLSRTFEILEISRHSNLTEIKNWKGDTLIHLAAKSDFSHSSDTISDFIQSNITFPSLVLDAFVESGGKQVLNIGSFWQHYDNKMYKPNSFYAATKQCFEDIIEFYVAAKGIEAISLHLFDTYGPNDTRKKIFRLIYDAAIRSEPLKLTSGKQFSYMTHINDVINAIELSLEYFQPGHQKFFVKPEEVKTLREVVEIFISTNHLSVDLVWGEREHSSRDYFFELDVLPNLPNWHSQISLKQGLTNLFEKSEHDN